MTPMERRALISKISLQLYRAQKLRQGVVLSHQLVEYMLNELKRIEGLEQLCSAVPVPTPPLNLAVLSTHDIKR